MNITKLEIGVNIRKLLIEVLRCQDVKKETKEEIAKSVLSFVLPKYIISNQEYEKE